MIIQGKYSIENEAPRNILSLIVSRILINFHFVIAVQWPIWVSCLNIWNYDRCLTSYSGHFNQVHNDEVTVIQIKPNRFLERKDFISCLCKFLLVRNWQWKYHNNTQFSDILHHENIHFQCHHNIIRNTIAIIIISVMMQRDGMLY